MEVASYLGTSRLCRAPHIHDRKWHQRVKHLEACTCFSVHSGIHRNFAVSIFTNWLLTRKKPVKKKEPPGLQFPSKLGTPLEKWGPPASSTTSLYRKKGSVLKSRPVCIEPVIQKWGEKASSCILYNWRHHFGARTAEIYCNLCNCCYTVILCYIRSD